MTVSSYLGPLAAFVLIVAMIPAAVWLLKRSPMGGLNGAAAGGLMRVVASLPLAPNQRLVTVEVGTGDDRRWLVLGITPAGIQTLHTLPPQTGLPPAIAPGLPVFAQMLRRLQAKSADADTGAGHVR